MHFATAHTATCSLVCAHELDNRRVNFTRTCNARARSSSVYVVVLLFRFLNWL